MDHRNMKLGVKAFKQDSRTLKIERYTKSLPPAPTERNWTHGTTDFGMMLNDQLGDCTIAACGHAIQVWSMNSNRGEINVSDSMILRIYENWTGYTPSDSSTDNGAVELDVLTKWRKVGFNGHSLLAYASVNPANPEEVRQAINLFGGVYIGLDLPLSAQNQSVWNTVYGDSGKAGSWGGHAVFVPEYDKHGFTAITWGALQPMTNTFWADYVVEAYALLSLLFIESANSQAPSGFNLAALKSDLSQIR